MRVLVIGRTIEEGNNKLREIVKEHNNIMEYRSSSNGDSFYTVNGDEYKVVTTSVTCRCRTDKIYAQYGVDSEILKIVFLPMLIGDLPYDKKVVRW